MAVGNHSKVIPPLVSAPRITTLVASLLVALSAGTNYVYSAYAPQLGARLGISHTQLNVVGLAGNIGVYTSGPLWGRIVDKRGPRILLASGFVLLLGGYSGMRYLYNTGLPPGVESISFLGLCVLVLFSFMTGTGGNGGLTSAVNSTAKTFPDKARATATGVVISGFGLSAFFFSTISHMFFAGNTSAFFLVLALGTSFPMIMGFFLVRPIPLPEAEGYDEIDNLPDEVAATSALDRDATHTPLLDEDEDANEEEFRRRHENLNSDSDLENARVEGVELDSSSQRLALRNRSLSRGAAMALDVAPNLHGLKLVLSGDFLLLFTILSIVSGTGLMYINNVGSMSQALYAHQHPVYDEKEAAGWQATQVSTISLMNFSGRIFIGLVSDFAKNKYDIPRSYCLVLVTFMIFTSQVLTAVEDRIENLWVASSILGLAYGSAFSLFPNVCLEWFGMPHFSENWGYLSLSPMVAGNIFSVIFGQNLDAHDGSKKALLSAAASVLDTRSATSLAPQCLQGLECYVDTIYLTVGADFVAIILSVWAGLRDRRKIAIARRAKYVRRPASAWEAT
ncbi:MFS general substrate transporter [Agrocybe pediades]|nr:MFS general substrate transporter [Agrocybe pediades]